MTEYFNLLRYKELLQLRQKSTMSILDEAFLELLDLESDVDAQIAYNRREVYCSLIKQYLNNSITPRDFRSKYLEITKQDSQTSNRILKDFQKLGALSLSKDRNQFYKPIDYISTLCMEYTADQISNSDFYSCVKSEFLKLPKNLYS